MKPYTRSIIELFDGKKRYLIPLYQRKYAWNIEPQLEYLWDDIEKAIERITTDRTNTNPHFMGAIVISTIRTFGRQVQAFEVIDGQQRLTTFQILLSALRFVADHIKSNYGNEIAKYLLNEGIMEDPNQERYKLWPSITDRESFVRLIDSEVDTSKIEIIEEDIFNSKIITAHQFFKKRIAEYILNPAISSSEEDPQKKFDEYKLEKIFEALKEGLAIVSIELEGGDDPQTIFETLNSRGVVLSASDLMRNFIFQRAKDLGQTNGTLNIDRLYTKHWLPLDQDFWQSYTTRGRQSAANVDWMLVDHLSIELGNIVSIDSLFDEYKKWIRNNAPFNSVEDELRAITKTSEAERKIIEKHDTDTLGKFGKFSEAFDVSTVYPLVIYLSNKITSNEELENSLNIIESFILRRDICGLTTKGYNRLYVSAIEHLRKSEKDIVISLSEFFSQKTSDIDRWPKNDEFMHQWIARDQYKNSRQSRLRYIFEGIEKNIRSQLDEDILIKSTLTIEHIMPQSWETNWPIIEDNEEADQETLILKRKSCINRIGNLTLLTNKLNSTVSNGPFDIKLPAILQNSSLALNRELMKFMIWNEHTIDERSKNLFLIAQNIWSEPKN